VFGGADKRIARLVRGRASLSKGMGQLLEFCGQTVPSPLWQKLRGLDYASDRKHMSIWLEQLLSRKPPTKRIKGLWFGLFNRSHEDGLPTCCIHLAGSSRFNFDDPALDCFSEPQYLPAHNTTESQILTTIFRSVDEVPEAATQGEYTLCWGYASLLVRDWCRGEMRHKLLGDAQRRGVAVGFDSGDGIVVDVLEQN
jgi:hypothetical protein